jgi:hypothetical protein
MKSAQITNCYVGRIEENRRSARKMGIYETFEKSICYNGVVGRANRPATLFDEVEN